MDEDWRWTNNIPPEEITKEMISKADIIDRITLKHRYYKWLNSERTKCKKISLALLQKEKTYGSMLTQKAIYINKNIQLKYHAYQLKDGSISETI